MQLSKSSVLYRSAKFQTELFNGYFSRRTDLCKFMRSYLFYVLRNTIVGVFFSLAFTSTLMVGGFGLANHFSFDPGGYTIGVAIFFAMGCAIWFMTAMLAVMSSIMVLIFGVYWLICKLLGFDREDAEPGVIETYFHSWRHKYCASMEFVD